MQIPNRHFSPFKLYVDRERRVAIMLNPKVLTTFTREFLSDGVRLFYGKDDPSDGRLAVLNFPRRFPVAPARDYMDFLSRPEAYDLYGFVRNPYARLLSAWKNKFLDPHELRGGRDDSAYEKSIRKRHLKPIRKFAQKRGLQGHAPHTEIPFKTFLRYAAEDRTGRKDHHWSPQVEVMMLDRFAFAGLFHIEDELEAGFRIIAERLDFDPNWSAERLSRKSNASAARPRRFYDEEAATLAAPLTAPDIAALKYEAESWKGL